MEAGKREGVLTVEESRKIEEAVRLAEQGTRGEIVVSIVERSSDYAHSRWAAATAVALGALLTWLPFRWTLETTSWSTWALEAEAALVFLLALAIAHLAVRKGFFLRFLVGRRGLIAQAEQRAHRAFSEHGLHRTRDGTGVLIQVSLLEHHVRLMADHGVSSVAPHETWDSMVLKLIGRVKAGELVNGLVEAVGECGALLKRTHPAAGQSNPDEIPNAPRQ